jgi:hypothetical protein
MAMRTILFMLAATLAPLDVFAVILKVGPGQTYSTIQAAIDSIPTAPGAAAGYVILVHPGTYVESVHLPPGLSGTLNNPLVLKALFPARKPYDGTVWADTTAKRSVIDATGREYGIYSGWDLEQVRYLLVDGFHIIGATRAAIYFEHDSDVWIRNNAAINTGIDAGENWGGYALIDVPEALVQNNLWELSSSGGMAHANGFNHLGVDGIYEYNECALLSGIPDRGRCFYFHLDSERAVFRYNFLRLHNRCSALCWRMRDSADQLIYHNYVYSSEPQIHTIIHENTNFGEVEGHQIGQNTWFYAQGAIGDYPPLGMGFLNQSVLTKNIVVSGVADGDSYAFGRSYTDGSHTLTFTDNVWWNYRAFRDPGLCFSGCVITESGTQNLNPGIAASTGCASAVDNNTYGANLNISSVPYRQCNGTPYPVASKFNLVSPSGLTNLRTVP